MPYDPLTAVAWHSAFWASDPSWTPPADGSGVPSWRNAGTNTNAAVQATSGKQPLYRASVGALNNQPAVEFDGVDDRLTTPSFSSVAEPYSACAIGMYRTTTAGNYGIDLGAGSGLILPIYVGPASFQLYQNSAAVLGPAKNTNAHCFVGEFVSGANDRLTVDGTAYTPGTAGSTAATIVSLGNSDHEPVAGWATATWAFVGFKASAFTTQEKADLLAWAHTFYGTPSSGTSQTLTTITGTGTVNALGKIKSRTLGLVTGAGTVLGLGRTKSRTLGTVTETGTVNPLTGRKSRTLDTITETCTVWPLGRTKSQTLGVITEVGTVHAITTAVDPVDYRNITVTAVLHPPRVTAVLHQPRLSATLGD